MEETQATYRWVAGPSSANEAADTFLRAAMRRKGVWLFLGCVCLAFATYMSIWTVRSDSVVVRLGWSLVFSGAFTAVVLAVAVGAIRVSNRRIIRRRIRPGDELTSRFGATTLELSGPLSRHELSFVGLTSVDRVGDWVHLRQVGSPIVMLWPAALFPDSELTRLKGLVGARNKRS